MINSTVGTNMTTVTDVDTDHVRPVAQHVMKVSPKNNKNIQKYNKMKKKSSEVKNRKL